MFETVELGRHLDKETFRREQARLRTELLKIQRRVEEEKLAVVILVNGVDGAGRGDVVNVINEWMDVRNIATVAFDTPTDEEQQRPPAWRYWMALPPAGSIAVFTGAWYTGPICRRAYGETDDADLDQEMHRIVAFERMLHDAGIHIIKLWLHISEAQQKKTFKRLRRRKETAWRVTSRDLENQKRYAAFRRVTARSIRITSTGDAPWIVIEAADRRYRRVEAASQVLRSIETRLAQPAPPSGAPTPQAEDPFTILDTLDLSLRLEREAYSVRLERAQARLAELSRRASSAGVGTTIVFEGADAAGKGGAIRRIIAPLDARHYRVIRIAAPTDEELAHHYLWRFWRHLPRLGRFTIYDRSWYGRVLVERVEGVAHRREWSRAYKEINDFEGQLVDAGILLIKFWLHISAEEQLRRFEAREKTPWKQYKITDEDYRNRDKAHAYEAAASEMVGRTSSEMAPWTLVEAEDKRYARVKVVETVCDRLEAHLAAIDRRDEPRRKKKKKK
ncbi:MAG: polyphosphate:AMP phosphotransferase [Myxococcota bacterium]